jgi:hypothetical protein
MTEREDDDQDLSDLAAIAPDVGLVREVVEISRLPEDDEQPEDDEPPEDDDASGTG